MQFFSISDVAWDHIEHLVELGTVAFAAYRVISAANRILDILKDFPPHRHINGRILFPKGYSPSAVESLSPKESRAGD
jgi:hypothetical protein